MEGKIILIFEFYNMVKYIRLLLLPFSVIYGVIIVLRNKMYDYGIFGSTKFEIPVICIGNLVVGGSGKSPVTEYLVELLGDYKIAILSRGYGRDTTGFFYADKSSTAKSIGDEPLQFYNKFPQVTVAVCEDRVKGINRLKNDHDLIILDDAYQHRSVRPGFSILLFEFQKLLSLQFLLPAGNLRETFGGYKRADVLMVTKSPEILSAEQQEKCIAKFDNNSAKRLFFSHIKYGDLKSLLKTEVLSCAVIRDKTVFLLTGIANPQPMLSYLKQFSTDIIHHDYPDHHQFSLSNISRLAEAFERCPAKEKIIITTEKDAQRLFDVTIKELLLNLPVFYLPIKIAVQEEEKFKFDQKILNYVSDTARNH